MPFSLRGAVMPQATLGLNAKSNQSNRTKKSWYLGLHAISHSVIGLITHSHYEQLNLSNIIAGIPYYARNHEARYDSVLTSTCCRKFEGELAIRTRRNILPLQTQQARKFDNVVGFPLKFERGEQVWPKKCAMQSPIKKSFHAITASDDHVSNYENVALAIWKLMYEKILKWTQKERSKTIVILSKKLLRYRFK